MTLFSWERWGSVLDIILFNNALKSMKKKPVAGRFAFYRSTELLFSILIIGILCAFAIPQFMLYKNRAILIHAFGYKTLLDQVHVYHSLTGLWPADVDQLEAITHSLQLLHDDDQAYIESVHVDHGAVDVKYKRELEGKTLTLRPAVPNDDLQGPVIWLAGDKLQRQGWTVFGEDKSDVSPVLINQFLR